jgi:hypothetical protein
MLFNLTTQAQTVITANNTNGNYVIGGSVTWSDPVYHIKDDIQITSGATLTISAGVKLIFFDDQTSGSNNLGNATQTGIFIFKSSGSLIVMGSANNLVTFTADNINTGWEGLVFHEVLNNQYSEINYSIIEYVKKTGSGCGSTIDADGAIFLNDFDNITLRNSFIRNNSISKRGGAIFISTNLGLLPGIQNGQIYIYGNLISNNTAKIGGAICLFSNNLFKRPFALIQNNQISDNISNHSGGAISILREADATIKNNSIIGNIAYCATTKTIPTFQGGGGISVSFSSTAIIEDNYIEYNRTYNYAYASSGVSTGIGGGILISTKSEAIINRNRVATNEAYKGGGIAIVGGTAKSSGIGPSYVEMEDNYIRTNQAINGGGILILNSHGTIERNEISNNTAINGGGLFIKSSTDTYGTVSDVLSISNSIINNNEALRGGGIWIDGESWALPLINTFELINNQISNNVTSVQGAAIYIGNNINLALNNNTICKNYSGTSLEGDGLYVEPTATNNNLSIHNNLIYFNGLTQSECQINQYYLDPNSYFNNNIMMLDCILGPPLNFDFPPDFVDLYNNDFRLSPSSLIIDLGNNGVFPVSSIDLDNNPRINNIIDIGAYEYYPSGNRLILDKNSDIMIYPNPTSSNLYVEFNSVQSTIVVEIFNPVGNRLEEITLYESLSAELDLSTYSSGIYFIKISSDFSVNFQKIIKK